MQIYVCVKRVPDTAANIIIRGKNDFDRSVKYVMNPYDELALEEAVRIKERLGDCRVTAITLGSVEAVGILQGCLAVGADQAVLVESDEHLDNISTALALAAAMKKLGRPDLVLTGKLAIDSEGMQTMFRLGHALGLPVAANVVELTLEGDRLTASCEGERGSRYRLGLYLPCLISAGRGLNQPRTPKLPEIIKARKKEIQRLVLAELDLPRPAAGVELVELLPVKEKRRLTILQGDAEAMTGELVRLLHEQAQVI